MRHVMENGMFQILTFTLLLLAFHSVSGAGELPTIRSQEQLNQETRVWVNIIETVKASGKSVSVYNDGSDESKKNLVTIVGPFVPLDRVEWAWVDKDGVFGLKFKQKHQIDVPLDNGGYIRIKLDDAELKGELIEAKTVNLGVPLKVMVFFEPHTMQIDRLKPNRKSSVPKMGRILGLLPHIVAMAYYEKDGLPLAAPQFNGMGTSENPRLIKDLLGIDDTLIPEGFLVNNP
jgi:hypothetical protein